MKTYGQNNRFDNRNSNNRRSFGRDNNREMYNTVCDNCGKGCQVPFKPTQGKPVFCNDCFKKNSGYGDTNKSFSRFEERRPNNFDTRFNKFEKKESAPTERINESYRINQQLKELNSKIDMIMELLQSNKIVSSKVKNIVKKTTAKKVKKMKTEA